jgi:tetratricopeptide (TPR) repeat protein
MHLDGSRPAFHLKPPDATQYTIAGWMAAALIIGAVLARSEDDSIEAMVDVLLASAGLLFLLWVWWTAKRTRRAERAAAEWRLREAENFFRIAYRIEELPKPVEGNLAEVLTERGTLDNAERKLVDSLKVQEAYLGDFHPHLRTTLNALANIRLRQRRPEDAQSLFARAAGLPPMPNSVATETAIRFLNEANALAESHNFVEAQRRLFQALAILERNLEHNAPAFELVLSALGVNERRLGRYCAAEGHLRRCAAIVEEHAGRESVRAAHVREHLAWILVLQGRLREAGSLIEEAGAIVERRAAAGSGELCYHFFWAAEAYRELGQYHRAEQSSRSGLAVCPPDESSLALFWLSLAKTCCKQGRLDEADSWASQGREVFAATQSLIFLAAALVCQAQVCKARRDLDSAVCLLEESLALQQRIYGAKHRAVAACAVRLAEVFHELGRREEANQHAEDALATFRGAEPPNPLELALAMHVSGIINASDGNLSRATQLLGEALALRAEMLDPDHPDLLETQRWYQAI